MKRLVWVCALIALCLLIVPQAQAATENGYTYSIISGGAKITAYSGTIGETLDIPATLGGYPVTAIGDRVFEAKITTPCVVTMPDTITTLGSVLFYDCTGLTDIKLSAGLTEIPNYCFADTGLTSVVLPAGVTRIGDNAFESCDELASITLPEGLMTIGTKSFYSCSKLTGHLVVPETVTTMGEDAFVLTNFTEGTLPCKVAYASRIPSAMKKLTITGSGAVSTNAFWNASLEEVVIQGPTQVDMYAFRSNASLHTLTLGESVATIGKYAFLNCTSLKTVNLAEGLVTIDSAAFQNTAIEELILPSTVETLGSGAFADCTALTTLELNEGLTTLSGAFAHCTGLSGEIVLPETVTSITGTFQGCTGITGVQFPAGLQTIGRDTFLDCTGLTGTLTLPASIKRIDLYAFKNCSGLTGDLELPSSVTQLGYGAFAGCTGLDGTLTFYKDVNIQFQLNSQPPFEGCMFTRIIAHADPFEGNYRTNLSNVWLNYSGLLFGRVDKTPREFVITGGKLLSDTFKAANNVTSVTLDASVTAIPARGFSNITSDNMTLSMPGVTEIGDSAFLNTTAIKVYDMPKVHTIGAAAFSGAAMEEIILGAQYVTVQADSFAATVAKADVYAQGTAYGQSGLAKLLADLGCTKLHIIGPNQVPVNVLANATGKITEIVICQGVPGFADKAFANCTALQKVTIPAGVSSIGNEVFTGCSALAEVVMGPDVTSIGNKAFYECKMLAKLELPAGLKTIGASAFRYTAITSAAFTAALESIGDYAFANTQLASAIIPESAEKIGTYVFTDCKKLAEAHLPANMTEIPAGMFDGCTALGSIDFPKGLVSIGKYAFYYSGLTSLDIPDTVTSIGDYAFTKCQKLLTADLTGPLTELPQNIFSECTLLSEVKLPAGVVTIGSWAFADCKALTGIDLPDTIKDLGGKTFEDSGLKELVIPPLVTSIEHGLALNCKSLERLVIPEGVTSIGQEAFMGCTKLDVVTVPASVTNIFYSAFESAVINEVKLLSSSVTVDERAFRWAKVGSMNMTADEVVALAPALQAMYGSSQGELDTLTITGTGVSPAFNLGAARIRNIILKGFDFIGSNAFENATEIKYVDMGSAVGIYESAFKGCTSLEDFTVSSQMLTITQSAFEGCTALKSIDLAHTGILFIGDNAFKDCTGVTEGITLPKSVKTLGQGAFANVSTTSLTLPIAHVKRFDQSATDYRANCLYGLFGDTYTAIEHLKLVGTGDIPDYSLYGSKFSSLDLSEAKIGKIGWAAFCQCDKLTSLEIPEGLDEIESHGFQQCSSLASVKLPSTAYKLGDSCFSSCTSLKSITMPRVTELGTYCFMGCKSLKSVSLAYYLSTIPEGCFMGCSGLTEIYFSDLLMYIKTNAFFGCTSLDGYMLLSTILWSLDSYAFQNCSSLDGVGIPSSLQTYGNSIFTGAKPVLIHKNTARGAAMASREKLTQKVLYTDDEVASYFDVTGPDTYTVNMNEANNLTDLFKPVKKLIGCAELHFWTSDESIAVIKNGEFVPLKTGTVKLYAGVPWDVSTVWSTHTCTVTITCELQDFTLPEAVYVPVTGHVKLMPATMTPANAETGITWTVADTSLATVDEDGLLTAGESTGTTMLVAISDNGIMRTTTLHIVPNASKVTLSCDNITMLPGSSIQLLADVTMGDYIGDNRFATYHSADPDVATVTYRGFVTAVSEGTTTITAEAYKGAKSACTVVVRSLSSLQQLKLPAALKSIDEEAFAGDNSIEYVILPEGANTIGSRAFAGCKGLVCVDIPASVESISTSAFESCGVITIRCEAGSYAETFAQEHGYMVILK